MPWSSQIFIGIPLKSTKHTVELLKRFNVQISDKQQEDPWFYENLNVKIDIPLPLDDKTYTLHFGIILSNDPPQPDIWKGEQYMCGVLFGANLTGRYKGCIIDDGSKGGRSDPFVLNLDLLKAIKKTVCETFLPEAEIMLMDVFY